MILLKKAILKAASDGTIVFSGDLKKAINPNSINVTLGEYLECYEPIKLVETKLGLMVVPAKKESCDIILDCASENRTYRVKIPRDGLILSPELFYLGYTVEKGGSSSFVPMYEGRSSLARLGLVSHFSAGFGDIGFESQWTLEIAVKLPLKVYSGMAIGQIYFMEGTPIAGAEADILPEDLYIGKYSEQSGVQPSKLHEDF